jgi:hypothetical protein
MPTAWLAFLLLSATRHFKWKQIKLIRGILNVSKVGVKVIGGEGGGDMAAVSWQQLCHDRRAATNKRLQPDSSDSSCPPITTTFVRICAFHLHNLTYTKLGRDSMFCRQEVCDDASNTFNHELNLNVRELSSQLTENTLFYWVLRFSQPWHRGFLSSGILRLSPWVNGSRCFAENFRLQIQGCKVRERMKMNLLEGSGIIHPATRRHVPEDWKPHYSPL